MMGGFGGVCMEGRRKVGYGGWKWKLKLEAWSVCR